VITTIQQLYDCFYDSSKDQQQFSGKNTNNVSRASKKQGSNQPRSKQEAAAPAASQQLYNCSTTILRRRTTHLTLLTGILLVAWVLSADNTS
jgi:hypothetical protein